MEIVLDNQQNKPEEANKRSSYAEIQITSPSSKEPPRTQEFKTEVANL